MSESGQTASRGIHAALLALALFAMGLAGSSAQARVVIDRATGQRFGIIPPPSGPAGRTSSAPSAAERSTATPTCDDLVDPQCSSPLTNPGHGPVQHGEREYLFFWDPNSAFPTGYAYEINRWLDDLVSGDYGTGHRSGGAVGNPISVVQQYYDLSGPGHTRNFIPYDLENAGTISDRDPFPPRRCTDSFDGSSGGYTFPMCLTAAQIESEVRHWVTARGLPTGLDVEYFVLTPPGVGTCNDTTSSDCEITSYCGEHTLIPTRHSQILYALVPWLPGTNCDTTALGITPVYSSGVDNAVGVFSHELSETMTDPDLDAWRGPGGGSDEVGDKCAYFYAVGQPYLSFTGVPQTAGGAYYNLTLGRDNYLVQMEFDNRFGGCDQWDNDPAPLASLALPHRPRAETPAAFSLRHVVDPAGIAYVRWSFGDGRSGRSSGLARIEHAFRRRGRYTVQAVITDNHGNELRKTGRLRVTGAG